jgi:hypothetical protein
MTTPAPNHRGALPPPVDRGMTDDVDLDSDHLGRRPTREHDAGRVSRAEPATS